jgi:hypothetical protein
MNGFSGAGSPTRHRNSGCSMRPGRWSPMLARRTAGVEVPDTRAIFLIVLAHPCRGRAGLRRHRRPGNDRTQARRPSPAGRAHLLRGPRRCPYHRRGHGRAALAARSTPPRARRRVIRPSVPRRVREATTPAGLSAGAHPGDGGTHVALLTAFYVDNGRSLPVWDRLPHIAYWLLPGLVGVPAILRAMRRHRVLRPRPAAVTPSDDSANSPTGAAQRPMTEPPGRSTQVDQGQRRLRESNTSTRKPWPSTVKPHIGTHG